MYSTLYTPYTVQYTREVPAGVPLSRRRSPPCAPRTPQLYTRLRTAAGCHLAKLDT